MRPCTVCRGERLAYLVRDNGFDWERCEDCGFVRIRDVFSLADIAGIENDAVGETYIATYKRKFDRKMTRSRRRAARIRRRTKGNDFLDVGSNFGFMVEAAARLGFSAVGVETNRVVVAAAREQFPGRTFLAGLLEEQDFGAQRFDAVYCSEVIEHTVDPRQFLMQISAVMRPGAILYLTTPHIREYRKRNYVGMGGPGHKLYFDENNIGRLLRECGFPTVRQDFTFFRGIKLWATVA